MAAARLVSLRAYSEPPSLTYVIHRTRNLASNHYAPVSVSSQREFAGAAKNKPVPVVVKAATAASEGTLVAGETKTDNSGVIDLASLKQNATSYVFLVLKVVTKRRPWRLTAQMLIEKAVIDCRFFTLFGVMGCLVGSVLCFVEGCFFVIESYLQYFNSLSRSSDHHGDVMHLLIEALDMYMIGTALLIFGMGLHVMFVGSSHLKEKATSHLQPSSFFGLFSLEGLPRWVGMQSVSQAKSKIGHAVMMMMQVGLLDKFKTVPMVTGLDLACFAAALFISSACIFVLSRLSFNQTE